MPPPSDPSPDPPPPPPPPSRNVENLSLNALPDISQHLLLSANKIAERTFFFLKCQYANLEIMRRKLEPFCSDATSICRLP